MIRRLAVTTVVAATVSVGGSVLGPVAGASHCSTPISLSSGYGATAPSGDRVLAPAPNPNPFPACSLQWLVPQEQVDTRVIAPGTTFVAVSYLDDLGVSSITATLNGMGFAGTRVTLTRTVLAGGGVLYSGPWLEIPTGPATSGSIRVDANSKASVFRTLI